MKMNIFEIYFLLIISITFNSVFSYFPRNKNKYLFIDTVVQLIKLFNDSQIIEKVNNLTQNCTNAYFNFIHNNNSIIKFYEDSSSPNDDIKKYYNCFNDLYGDMKSEELNNYTFIIVYYRKSAETGLMSYDSFSKMFGLCVPKGCNEIEYGNIIQFFQERYNFSDYDINTTVKDLTNENHVYKIYEIILQFIPLALMILFFLSNVFINFTSRIFVFLMSPFLLEKGNKNYNKKLSKKYLRDETVRMLKVSSNFQEIMPSKEESEIYKTNGLEIISGLRVIALLFFFLGQTLKNIYSTPTRLFNEEEFKNYMKTLSFNIVFFFSKISVNFLYALSGFELTYRFIVFLDNELSILNIDFNIDNKKKDSKEEVNMKSLKQIKSGNNVLNEEDSNNLIHNIHESIENDNVNNGRISAINSDSSSKQKESSKKSNSPKKADNAKLERHPSIKSQTTNGRKRSSSLNRLTSFEQLKIEALHNRYAHTSYKISCSSLFSFIFRQLHLYLIFVFMIIYYRFFDLMVLSQKLLKRKLIYSIKDGSLYFFPVSKVFTTIFLISNFFGSNVFNFFVIPMNEIFFFLFGTILIFICYKKQYRLDIILLIIILIVEIAKLSMYFYFRGSKFYPSLGFLQVRYNDFQYFHLLNLPYYCIGMFFGLANYSIQIEVAQKETFKLFSLFPMRLIIKSRKLINYFIITFFMVAFLIFDMFFLIFFTVSKDTTQGFEEFFTNDFVNIFSLYEVEICLFLIFLFIFITYYSGNNILFQIFNISFGKIISKCYFCIILIAPKSSNYFLFDYAERIDLGGFSFFYLFFLMTTLSLLKAFIIFVLFQVPLKKLTKIIFNQRKQFNKEIIMSKRNISSVTENINNKEYLSNNKSVSSIDEDLNMDD